MKIIEAIYQRQNGNVNDEEIVKKPNPAFPVSNVKSHKDVTQFFISFKNLVVPQIHKLLVNVKHK